MRPGGQFTPWLVESIVRLGACLPFAQVPALLAHFTGVTVSAATVRRLTEAAGAALVAHETAVVAELTRTMPDPPLGPPVQQLSVDGAMVPLVGGEWAEAKTLAVGTVTAAAGTVTTGELSYCSRLADAATFGELATIETHRRGTVTAGTVVAVTDGAPWCQSFVDLHRPDAVRILDFPHAVAHLGHLAQAWFGPGTAEASEWLGRQAHALRHGQEVAVLAEVAVLNETGGGSDEARAVLTGTLGYLTARCEQLHYQTFAAAGYPIGSGCVESANKLVVEARLKGAGMHGARANVNPMLALRTAVCNGQWEADWVALWTRLRRPAPPTPMPPCPPAPPPSPVSPHPLTLAAPSPQLKTIVNGKPTADHPWRRSAPFRAKR